MEVVKSFPPQPAFGPEPAAPVLEKAVEENDGRIIAGEIGAFITKNPAQGAGQDGKEDGQGFAGEELESEPQAPRAEAARHELGVVVGGFIPGESVAEKNDGGGDSQKQCQYVINIALTRLEIQIRFSSP